MRLPATLSLLFSLWLLGPRQADAQELPLTHYTPDSEVNPLPAAGVTDVYQDRDGYLWLTILSAGLVRYDGHTLETYGGEDGLIDLNTNGLVEDAAGHLWVNSVGGIAVSKEPLGAYVNGRRVQFTARWGGINLARSPANNKSIAAGPNGTVWVGTSADGVLRYRLEDSWTLVADTLRTDVLTPGKNEPVYSLIVRRDGTVWAGTSGGRLLLYEERDRFKVAATVGDALDMTTTIMYEDAAGRLWGGCHDGTIWRLAGGDGSHPAVVDTALEEWVEDIMETPDGRLWFASLGSGLRRLDLSGASPGTTYTRRHGLLSNVVHGGATDREGNLWFGSDQGLSRLRANHEAFDHFTATSYAGEQPSLPAATVTSVVPADDAAGRPSVWVGTAGGVAGLHPGGGQTFIGPEQGLPSAVVYALEADQQGRVWIGLNGRTAVLLPEGALLPSFGEVRMHDVPLPEGALRLGSLGLGNIYFIKRLPLPADEQSRDTVESLWFLSYRKIVCLVGDEWFTFRQDAGFPPTASAAVALDEEDHLWVGTDDQGLFRSRFPLSRTRLRDLLAAGPGEQDGGREITAPVLEPVWNDTTGAPRRPWRTSSPCSLPGGSGGGPACCTGSC